LGGEISPYNNPKKGMRLVQKDFCGKKGSKLPYFEGEKQLKLLYLKDKCLHVNSI
jgi:hypothetical protein